MRDEYLGLRVPVLAMDHARWFYLYRLWADEVLLYVGVTGDVYTRWTQHRRRQPWGDEVTHVSAQRFAYLDLALDAERAAVLIERPLHNVRLTEADNARLGRARDAARRAKAVQE